MSDPTGFQALVAAVVLTSAGAAGLWAACGAAFKKLDGLLGVVAVLVLAVGAVSGMVEADWEPHGSAVSVAMVAAAVAVAWASTVRSRRFIGAQAAFWTPAAVGLVGVIAAFERDRSSDPATFDRTVITGVLLGVLILGGFAYQWGVRLAADLSRTADDARNWQTRPERRGGGRAGNEASRLESSVEALAEAARAQDGALRLNQEAESSRRSRMESVFEAVSEAVVAIDGERRITDLNPAALELLNLNTVTEALGEPVDRVVRLLSIEGFAVSISAPRDRSRLLSGDLQVPDVGMVPVVGTVSAMGRDGRRGMVVVLRDVRRERALEIAKQNFLATIGHELRTPLVPIKGYAGVMRRRVPNEEQAQAWAQGIEEGVNRLEHQVSRLVTFASLSVAGESGSEPMSKISPAELIVAASNRWVDRVAEPKTLEVDVDHDGPNIEGDAVQLALLLDELIENAVRFGPESGPIEIGHREADDGTVELYVIDGGGAQAAELLSAVDPFVQGEAFTIRVHGGLGMGLALSARIARAHRGRLVIDPLNGATTLAVRLPVASA